MNNLQNHILTNFHISQLERYNLYLWIARKFKYQAWIGAASKCPAADYRGFYLRREPNANLSQFWKEAQIAEERLLKNK